MISSKFPAAHPVSVGGPNAFSLSLSSSFLFC